jgi:hypothetical protein
MANPCNDPNSKEGNEALAARTLASLDSILGTNNTKALEKSTLEAQLHYASWKTELDSEKHIYGPVEIDKKLASPYKDYFNVENEKINKTLNNATHLVLGNHPDNIRPSEIIGDNIVRPVEDAYRKYSSLLTKSKENGVFDDHIKEIENQNFKNPELREKLMEHREDSGYEESIEEAQDKIEKLYGDGKDDDRYHYGMAWIKSLSRSGPEDGFSTQMIVDATNNLVENHLRNNLVSAGRNYFDRWRAAYQFGIHNYVKGQTLWNGGKNSHSQELEESGIGGSQFMENKKGPDLFQKFEPGNKAITYFAAKSYALEKGYSTKEAKLYARKAVEQLQFQNSFVNRPKNVWGTSGRTNLSLFSFGVQERHWYQSLWKGAFNSDPTIAKQARKALLYYMVGNGILFGTNADIPEEIGQTWKYFAPESYKQWRAGVGTLSLAKALNLSMDEISRIPLTGVGMALKTPVVFDDLKKTSDDIGQTLNHPNNPRKWIKAISHGTMLLPAGLGIPKADILGNKMSLATVDYLYRSIMGDYTRWNGNKKYQTSNIEELGNAIRGGRQSLSRDLERK